MALDAFIFDMDGTLVDTNGLHGRAWKQALEAFGYNVGVDRLLLEIGKGGDRLVPSVLGEDASEKHGEALRRLHGETYRKMIQHANVKVFPRVRELFDAVHARGMKIAVATASKKENLEAVVEHAGLNLIELADEVVTDTDVKRSKPAPDVVHAAIKKLGVSPAQCVMVGDTPYDAQACAHAGVVCVGVLTGVYPADTMYRAGCRVSYADTGDLLDHLDEVLEVASPGSVHLTYERMHHLMDAALDHAKLGMAAGERPVGAVVAGGDGTIVSRGHDEIRQRRAPLARAEMIALGRLPEQLPEGGRGLVLATTLEPSVMCYGAAMAAGVDTIIYALESPNDSGLNHCQPIAMPGTVVPRVVDGICREEARRLFEMPEQASR